jgi:hypothetical protein
VQEYVDLRELPPVVTVCATIWKVNQETDIEEGGTDVRDKGLLMGKSVRAALKTEKRTPHTVIGSSALRVWA